MTSFFKKVNIYREKTTKETTKENRRHDIFIEGLLDNKIAWVISIENKLQGAVDREDQMNDYAIDLKNYVSESYFLIYLPVFSNNPPEISISEKDWAKLMTKKKAMVLSASMIIQWLDNTIIIAPAVKQFCNDFKKFLSEDIMGNTQNSNELVEYLVNNDKVLFSALTVLEAKKSLYEKLIKMLIEQLKIRCFRYIELINYGFEFGENGTFNNKEYELYLGDEEFGVSICFATKEARDPYYGVYAHGDKLFDGMTKIFHDFIIQNNFDEPEGYYPVSKWFEDEYEVWDATVLSKIPSGELANYIFELWEPLLDIISKNLDKIKELKMENA